MPIRPSPARDTRGPPRPSVVVSMRSILGRRSSRLVRPPYGSGRAQDRARLGFAWPGSGLLRAAGRMPTRSSSGVDETAFSAATPAELAGQLARPRRPAVAAGLPARCWVIGWATRCSTGTGGRWAKPASGAEAAARCGRCPAGPGRWSPALRDRRGHRPAGDGGWTATTVRFRHAVRAGDRRLRGPPLSLLEGWPGGRSPSTAGAAGSWDGIDGDHGNVLGILAAAAAAAAGQPGVRRDRAVGLRPDARTPCKGHARDDFQRTGRMHGTRTYRCWTACARQSRRCPTTCPFACHRRRWLLAGRPAGRGGQAARRGPASDPGNAQALGRCGARMRDRPLIPPSILPNGPGRPAEPPVPPRHPGGPDPGKTAAL